VSIRYVDGILTQALTRGDGKKGIDITTKMLLLVPNKIDMMGEIQITGEVVCPSRVPNARNVAAGSLNLKSIDEFHSRPLTFVAYDIMPKNHNLWSDDMQEIRNSGINTVLDSNWDEYPHDGEVFRLNSNDLFDELGYTAHHPRGAYAFKTRAEGVVTKLLDVVWQVGKSGVVSPVAILEPVVIGEAVVKRATLHNIRYIEELGLEIGCSVEVIRSGEIIPRIVRRV
jgi:DNA ligase (NAD+)